MLGWFIGAGFLLAAGQAPPAVPVPAPPTPPGRMLSVAYPEGATVKLILKATEQLPGAIGEARVRRKRGITDLDVQLNQMKPAILFGGDYNTYVLWVISPEGFAFNAGELILNGVKSRVKATTPLTEFSVVVTAEPYFLAAKPSKFVVFETTATGLEKQKGISESVFQFSGFARDYKFEHAVLAGVPENKGRLRTDRYQAIVAVRFAEEAGAEKWAPKALQAARTALRSTQRSFAQAVSPKGITLLAHRTVRLAVKARGLAEQRSAAAALAAERRAHRREVARYKRALAEAEAAAVRSSGQARMAREAEQKTRTKLERTRQLMLRANQEADRLARLKTAAEKKVRSAEDQAAAFYARLHNALGHIAEIHQSDRGLVVNLPDILFDSGKSRLRPRAREVLSRIAGVLLVAPEYHLSIEGHTDSTGRAELNQRLSLKRAAAVRNYLGKAQISPAMMSIRGFGESRPIASNRTAAGRQKNRRVEIIIEGLTE